MSTIQEIEASLPSPSTSVIVLAAFCDSSPYPWGTLLRQGQIGVQPRFIPTPVGNTTVGLCRHGTVTVHPHTRGEHPSSGSLQKTLRGSSPHPWGTQEWPFSTLTASGFIPTPVGNTTRRLLLARAATVHPHTRGEHTGGCIAARSGPGSSPHPWGTRHDAARGVSHGRFIPNGLKSSQLLS